MKKILAFVMMVAVLLPALSYGYSGDDLTGMIELQQIAQRIQLYADERDGSVDIPYAEVPGVAWSIEEIERQTRGTLVLADNETFSSVDAVPIGYYSVGGVVITGFSDGTAGYYRHTDRPPWVVLREGPTLSQRLMIASPVLNFILLIFVFDLWLSKRRRASRAEYEAGSAPVAERISSVAAGLLGFLLSWILLEMIRFVSLPVTASRVLDMLSLLIAATIGYFIFRARRWTEDGRQQ